MPKYANFGGEVVLKEVGSTTVKKGYPLNVDLSSSDASVVALRACAADEAVFWLSSQDGQNDASAIAISNPIQLRVGDIVSASLATGGANLATTVDHIGDRAGWSASSESGETAKAVLDIGETSVEQFLIVGFDDRDAIGTSGGRMLAEYLGLAHLDLDVQQS